LSVRLTPQDSLLALPLGLQSHADRLQEQAQYYRLQYYLAEQGVGVLRRSPLGDEGGGGVEEKKGKTVPSKTWGGRESEIE